MNKIAIVGAGRVGEATAQFIAQQELCSELVLIDVREGAAQGVALDIAQTAAHLRFDTRLAGGSDLALMAGAELVVITAGIPRKPGMSRSDVLEANLTVIDGIIDNMQHYAPDAFILMVTNPVDVLTYRAYRRGGWDRKRVIGQAGVLDASRMAGFIAEATGFSVRDITTIVLGGHGDSMVPVPRFCTVNGVPVGNFLDQDTLDQIVQRTRDGGAEVLALRENSSAYDAPGASVAAMVDAISHGRRRLLPCVCILDGEYGQADIAMGVPCILGASGVESIVELPLNEAEQRLFKASAEQVRGDIGKL